MNQNPRVENQRHSALGHALVFAALAYAGLAVLLTWPVGLQLFEAVAGFDGRDSFQHVWYQWWMKETLLELKVWPDRVSHLYYPLGAEHPVLALHPYVPLVSLPFTVLLGPLASYNLAFLLSFILSGLTGYLLCRYISGHSGAAIIGGLIFAFFPNRFGHAAAGHLLLITNYFLPLYALSLLMLLRRPSPRMVVWHGIITALLALAQPTHIGYGLVPLLLILAAGYLIRQLRAPANSLKVAFVGLIIAHVLALLIFLPFAAPLLSQDQQSELSYLTPDNLTEHSTDLLAFIMPSPYNPVLAGIGLIPSFSTSIVDSQRDLEERLAYPGLVALGLAVLALGRKWRVSMEWLILTAGCALLSLGPLLKIGGEVQSLSLPYLWMARLPFFAWSRTPGRLNETVMLGMAVLASLGTAWLFQHLISGRRLLALGLTVLILVEYLVILPFPIERRPVSSYYSMLAAEPVSGGILQMPVTGSRRASNYAMYYQTGHEHPLAGGYIERDPPGTVELKEFLNQLVSPIPEQAVIELPTLAQRRSMLAALNIQQVIAQQTLMTDQAARATLAYLPILLGEPVFADDETLVFSIQAETSEDLPVRQLLPEQENWEVVHDGRAYRLKQEGYLYVYTTRSGQATLVLEATEFGHGAAVVG